MKIKLGVLAVLAMAGVIVFTACNRETSPNGQIVSAESSIVIEAAQGEKMVLNAEDITVEENILHALEIAEQERAELIYSIIANLSAETWQEAYKSLLYKYTDLQLLEMEAEWHFILHDIDRDGVPELFLLMHYETGHFRTSAVYTFTENKVVSLEYSGIMTDGGIFAPSIDNPWIVMFYAAGGGGWFRQMQIDKNKLIPVAQGDDLGDGLGYSLNGIKVTKGEFERVFGRAIERRRLEGNSITEDAIQNIIFGW